MTFRNLARHHTYAAVQARKAYHDRSDSCPSGKDDSAGSGRRQASCGTRREQHVRPWKASALFAALDFHPCWQENGSEDQPRWSQIPAVQAQVPVPRHPTQATQRMTLPAPRCCPLSSSAPVACPQTCLSCVVAGSCLVALHLVACASACRHQPLPPVARPNPRSPGPSSTPGFSALLFLPPERKAGKQQST